MRRGAVGKVRQLDEIYAHLRDREVTPIYEHDNHTRRNLNLAPVIKVSQAISSEIVLEKLIDTLMRTAIAQAGAVEVY